MLATARIDADVRAFGEPWLLQVGVALPQVSNGHSLLAVPARREEHRPREDLGVDPLPRDPFLLVEILAESLQVQPSVSHVHLDLLLGVVYEVVRGCCFTLEQIRVCQGIYLRTKLARAE